MFINLCISPARKKKFSQSKEQSINHNPSNQNQPHLWTTPTPQQLSPKTTPFHPHLHHHAQNRLPRTILRHPSPALRAPQVPRLGARSAATEPRGHRLQLAQAARRPETVQEAIVGGQTGPGAFLPRVLNGRRHLCVRGMDGWMDGYERR